MTDRRLEPRHAAFRRLTRWSDDDEPPERSGPALERWERRQRALFHAPRALKACQCGCGMAFPPAAGRRFHPQCQRKPGKRGKSGKPYKGALLCSGPPRPRRCPACWGMPHRRSMPVCRVCLQPFAEEKILRQPASVGCGLGETDGH